MKILFFDTETTGFPVWGKPSDDPCQSRVTQLHAELVDSETRGVIACISTYIRPNGWQIPEEIEKMIGITNDHCERFGISMGSVILPFLDMWKLADFRVGHNESFDMRMMRIEIFREIGDEVMADEWKAGASQCTQAMSKNIVALPATSAMHATGWLQRQRYCSNESSRNLMGR